MIDTDSTFYYLLLRAKPVYLILFINCFMCYRIETGSNSGNLLHSQCASTVFWYPQREFLDLF